MEPNYDEKYEVHEGHVENEKNCVWALEFQSDHPEVWCFKYFTRKIVSEFSTGYKCLAPYNLGKSEKVNTFSSFLEKFHTFQMHPFNLLWVYLALLYQNYM